MYCIKNNNFRTFLMFKLKNILNLLTFQSYIKKIHNVTFLKVNLFETMSFSDIQL